jgi:hypothetical protein
MPFTVEQFLEIFKNYNLAVWPMQVALYLMGVAMVFFGTRKAPASDRAIALILAFLWLWMGLMYHLAFFASINPAAYVFAAVFAAQGILFLAARNKLTFRFQRDMRGITGAILMFFALAVYPVWGFLAGHVYPVAPTFGLPCPTTIFTLGMLLWVRPKAPLYLAIIPLAWSLIGFSAAFSLGIAEDTVLPVSGLIAGFLLIRGKRTARPAHRTSHVA